MEMYQPYAVIQAERLCHNPAFVIARHRRWRGDLFFHNNFWRLLRRFSPRNDNYDTDPKAGIQRKRYGTPGPHSPAPGKRGVIIKSFILTLILLLSHSLSCNAADNSKHLLWTVKGSNNTLYLLGSIHLLKQDSYPLPDKIEALSRCCTTVVFETDLDGANDPAFQKNMVTLGSYTEGRTLSKSVSLHTLDLLKKRLTPLGLQLGQFERFKPWFVALSIAALELQKLGYDPELGIDRHFYNRAKKEGKELVFLETSEYQLNLMSGLKSRKQELFLKQILKDLEVVETMSADMVESWLTGDADRLHSIIRIGYKEYPDIYDRFITRRNRNWLPRLRKLMRQDKDVLVIVGSGHLVGENSLIQLFKEKGFMVEQH